MAQALRECRVRRLGRIEYADALRMQEGMVRLRLENKIPDTLLLLEHPHVITLGSNGKDEHVLADEAERHRLGIEIFESGRGGDVTYHGPGQIVGYPILRLGADERDAHRYLRSLEEMLIRCLTDFGIEARRVEGLTGIWTEHEATPAKIAAIGVRFSRWITSHGFALNVAPDLDYFRTIVPCGLHDKAVTSMQVQLGRTPPMHEVEDRLIAHFGDVFQRSMGESRPED